MMSRTQISLDKEMQRRARRRADELGVSLAEYVRRLIERDLGGPRRAVSAAAIFNLGSSGGSDIARDKDAMIAQAFSAARIRRRRSA